MCKRLPFETSQNGDILPVSAKATLSGDQAWSCEHDGHDFGFVAAINA
jgi:hypothetical protein